MIGNIYKIINSINQKVYIGSTTLEIKNRFSRHKTEIRRKHMILYAEMERIGIENFSIVLIEEIQVESKAELLRIEEKYIDEYRGDNCLNTIRAYASPENKKIKKKKYYLKHKSEIYAKQRESITKDKETHDKYKSSMITYYQKNKSKWSKNNGVKILCECERLVSKSNFDRHLKSPLHERKLNKFYLDLLPFN